MALYLGREAGREGERSLRRITLEWEGGELVLEPERNGHVRLHVAVGPEREEHRLDLDANAAGAISAQSKLIKIEEIGKSGALLAPEAKAAKKPTHVRAQSKLIKIEETGASLPEITIVLP